LLEPLLDLLGLPIAMGVLVLLAALSVPLDWLRWYAAAGMTIVAYHFLIAVKAGPDFWRSMQVLVMTPRYIFWKLFLLPKIVMNSRHNASWVRTQRDVPADFNRAGNPDVVD
jgi:hypothetical protein